MAGMISGALAMDTGYLNYPNIYFGKTHIGGLDDLKSHLQIPHHLQKLKDSLISSTDDSDSESIESEKNHIKKSP